MNLLQQKEAEALIRDVLGKDFLPLRATHLTFDETFESERVRVRCEVLDGQNKHDISGEGVGLIDAFFSGLKARLSETYPSLSTLIFVDFSVKADLATKQGKTGSDSKAVVELVVENPSGRRFRFSHSSRSVTHSSVEVVAQACTYFVNSELAFVRTRAALEHAQKEKRADSIDRYTRILTQLVENTSYSDVIKRPS